MLISDAVFKEFMRKKSLTKIVKGQWEGSFYSFDLFQEISSLVRDLCHENALDIHLEEFAFPMLAQKSCNKEDLVSPACYMEIGTHPALKLVDENLVNLIRTRSSQLILKGQISASKSSNIIRYLAHNTHIYSSIHHLYMVKRVDRNIHNSLRQYINQLD